MIEHLQPVHRESTSKAPGCGRARHSLITGMSGAGKTTALKALEDFGFECIDNLPLRLLSRLLPGCGRHV